MAEGNCSAYPAAVLSNPVRTACLMYAALLQGKICQLVVVLSVGRGLKVIVVLVVHLGLVKGELLGIIDINDLLAKGVWIVALALHQREPCIGGRFLNLWIARVFNAAWKTNQTSVFTPSVTGIHTIWISGLCKEMAIRVRERKCLLARKNSSTSAHPKTHLWSWD